MGKLSREDLIRKAGDVAARVEGSLTLRRFRTLSGVSEYQIYKQFEGGWSELREAAGIEAAPRSRQRYSDAELLEEYDRVVGVVGRRPSWREFDRQSRVSAIVMQRRFGGREGLLRRYGRFVRDRERGVSEPSVEPSLLSRGSSSGEEDCKSENRAPGVLYGAPLDFRGLRHAPVNEQGVVFLFGMVSRELGFLVESIQTAYPDCRGKRVIDHSANRWRPVRIEFEFRSSNFYRHCHDPAECDVIVCWEDDWLECPLDVIELRRVIVGE